MNSNSHQFFDERRAPGFRHMPVCSAPPPSCIVSGVDATPRTIYSSGPGVAVEVNSEPSMKSSRMLDWTASKPKGGLWKFEEIWDSQSLPDGYAFESEGLLRAPAHSVDGSTLNETSVGCFEVTLSVISPRTCCVLDMRACKKSLGTMSGGHYCTMIALTWWRFQSLKRLAKKTSEPFQSFNMMTEPRSYSWSYHFLHLSVSLGYGPKLLTLQNHFW